MPSSGRKSLQKLMSGALSCLIIGCLLEKLPTSTNVATSQDIAALQKQNKSLQQAVNQLEINDAKTTKGNHTNSSKTTGFCFDCGEEGETKGHDGCPNPGEKKFLPEKFKKQKPLLPMAPQIILLLKRSKKMAKPIITVPNVTTNPPRNLDRSLVFH